MKVIGKNMPQYMEITTTEPLQTFFEIAILSIAVWTSEKSDSKSFQSEEQNKLVLYRYLKNPSKLIPSASRKAPPHITRDTYNYNWKTKRDTGSPNLSKQK